mmetsp:Transcript_20650/g.44919  ORF Transcript_20650/g.44919 Transcript_20650/m.44919 type:complete len:98 (-) Transcript_20650:9-302(-)
MLRNGLRPDDPAWIKKRKDLEEIVPLGRIGEPSEMAGPITFLSSDMASYVTGVVLTADGLLTGAGPGRKPESLRAGELLSQQQLETSFEAHLESLIV